MKKEILDYLVCPKTKTKLELKDAVQDDNGNIISGILNSESGNSYRIIDGIPDLVILTEAEKNNYAVSLFDVAAVQYDDYQHLSFETFCENETGVRNKMIDKLGITENTKIIELNAGTGRDSVLISDRLSNNNEFHLQDISRNMLNILGMKKKCFKKTPVITKSNACQLPYPDKFFDAVYSFAGVGMSTYADAKAIFDEIIRITKNGARVVIGGLSLAPWLRNTEFGKILINHNTHYADEIALDCIPQQAKNVNLSWILSGAGFCLDFTVDEDAIKADFNYEIPGIKGGTHNTRYYGRLEGVSIETKELAKKARQKLGISMHKWLDELIKKESTKILEN